MSILQVPRDIFDKYIIDHLDIVDIVQLIGTCTTLNNLKHLSRIKDYLRLHIVVLQDVSQVPATMCKGGDPTELHFYECINLLIAIMWVNHGINLSLYFLNQYTFQAHASSSIFRELFPVLKLGTTSAFIDDMGDLIYMNDFYGDTRRPVHEAQRQIVPVSTLEFLEKYFPGRITWKFVVFPSQQSYTFQKGEREIHRGFMFVLKIKRGLLPQHVTTLSRSLRKANPAPIPFPLYTFVTENTFFQE